MRVDPLKKLRERESSIQDVEDAFGVPCVDKTALLLGLFRRVVTPASWFGVNNNSNKKYWLVNGRVQSR